ncbi:hypothetical protein J2S74_004810 [Evansella vedderi]|uniref:Uncharacterized protein n=1 Tax=Evansella vedderi TaxID=38282 RepID=A0ABU0A2X5_9BACI|nr:hypothetical protein [Evansella vedderi]MDQ0257352.1 hypothetical protein [Evansella vedderi]
MKLKWLKEQPKNVNGVTWGVPWKIGEMSNIDSIHLTDSRGNDLHLQTWPMAYWPDGSVKWTGHSTVITDGEETYELIAGGKRNESEGFVTVKELENTFVVDTGEMQCKINKGGVNVIEEIIVESKQVAGKGCLIGIMENRSNENDEIVYRQKKMYSKINKVELEQSGSIRSVIKLEGTLQDTKGKREGFPFQLRLYFFSNLQSIRIVHTFIYDGNPDSDFIKGLGLSISLPLKGDMWNRNIRFAGDHGIYSEGAQLLTTRRYPDGSGLFKKQIEGKRVDLKEEAYGQMLEHVKDNAIWSDFKMVQDSANHFKITKRTGNGCSWVDITHGKRAKGLLYGGGVEGGIAIALKDFWQKYPSSLEITNINQEMSTMTVWFWSPDGESMDLRHYDKDTHVVSAYEGFDEVRATPVGIANTSEVHLKVFSHVPEHRELEDFIEEVDSPPLLICEPEYYYDSNTLGVWSLPDRTNPLKMKLEEQLDNAVSFYKKEIDQRSWYGYWNYGDVMHTYDPVRHQWRYDMGGYAWQNTELVPNIWLWYAFLRSGREDIFRMAEAMTRHTSEVDRYHLGEYNGLGSRHNVVHWGCGCKEARISMAGLHKYYYFLTGDERTRELLEEVRDADHTTETLDPMREFYPKDEFPTHTRVGPDWAAFVSNWMSEWERTKNNQYRDKILIGMEQLKNMPFRLLSGPTYGYDPSTSKLYHIGDGNVGGYHMIISFGAPQVWMELANLIEDEEWKDMLAEFGEFYLLTNDEKIERSERKLKDSMFSWPMFASGMVAYAAARKKDRELAIKAWNLLIDEEDLYSPFPMKVQKITKWMELEEVPNISTNVVSQWCLNTIVALDLIGNYLPSSVFKENEPVQKSVK